MLNKAFTTIALLCFSTAAMPIDFYVALSGNDQANGLFQELSHDGANGPFRTLARVQKAIRDLKKNSQFNEPVTVHLQAGSYPLESPLEFDIRDSGFESREIRWLAENGPAIINGGITLQNCAPVDGKIWSCPTAGLALDKIKYLQTTRKQGNIPGFQLFVDQQWMQLARWPNTDWAHIKLPLEEKSRFNTFESLPPLQSDLSRAQVHILASNDWLDQYIAVSGIDKSKNEITLASKTSYPLASGRRFYLQNIQSELDQPGEWFYDSVKNKIDFIPPNNSKPKEIVVSALQKLFAIKGANYLSFNNLTFRYCNGIAVDIDKTSHIKMDNIEANDISGRAIEVRSSHDVTISNSHIHDTGEGGVLLAGGNRNTLTPANNLIHNSHIHDFSRVIMTYTPAIAIEGVGVSATHNLIEQSPGSGILVEGNDHLLEKNEIHHVCEQASDCGAIYMGRDWTYRGNVIRYNSIHDLSGYGLKSVDIANNKVVYARPDGVRGVYLDDMVSGFNIIGNIFTDAGLMAIQLGSGRDTVIENNIISTSHYALWVDFRTPGPEIKRRLAQVPYQSPLWLSKYPILGEPVLNESWPEGNSIQHNIIISNRPGNLALRYMMPAFSNTIENNLVWSTSGTFNLAYNILDKLIKRDGVTWQDWMNEGIERNSLIADPCVTISGNRVTFCPQSPALRIGFQPLPSDIGLIK